MYKLVAAILVGNGVGGRMVTAPHYTYNLLLPPGSDVRSVLPDRHVISSRHAAGVAQGGLISPLLVSLCVDMPSPSHHVELAFYADDTAIIVT